MEKLQKTVRNNGQILEFDLSAELNHGIAVSNLAYAVAEELGLDEAVLLSDGNCRNAP